MYGDVQLQIICKSLSTVFTHQVIKGRLSIMVVLYRRAIALSAKIINKGILAVELERAITSQAAETATTFCLRKSNRARPLPHGGGGGA